MSIRGSFQSDLSASGQRDGAGDLATGYIDHGNLPGIRVRDEQPLAVFGRDDGHGAEIAGSRCGRTKATNQHQTDDAENPGIDQRCPVPVTALALLFTSHRILPARYTALT